MTYAQLIQLYFERSNALQYLWTLYVVVIGGLLAISTLRVRPDILTVLLVSVLYCFFAYKNLDAIHDVSAQRAVVIQTLHQSYLNEPLASQQHPLFAPTLVQPDWDGTRNFHLAADALTLILIWAMEWRRIRHARLDPQKN